MCRLLGVLVILSLLAGQSFADVAPSRRLTKEEIRRQNKEDTCQKMKPDAKCQTMAGEQGTCKWFKWWWIPGTSEKGFENGKLEYASYQTTCKDTNVALKDSNGKSAKSAAFNCLICM